MPSRSETEQRLRKASKPFEGAELPRVNNTKQKAPAVSSKSVALATKKPIPKVKLSQKRPTDKLKASKKEQLGIILYVYK